MNQSSKGQSLNWYNVAPTDNLGTVSNFIDGESDINGDFYLIVDYQDGSYFDSKGTVSLGEGLNLLKINSKGEVVFSKLISTRMTYRTMRFNSEGSGYLVFTGEGNPFLSIDGQVFSGTTESAGAILILKINSQGDFLEPTVLSTDGKVYEEFFQFHLTNEKGFTFLYGVEGNVVDDLEDELYLRENLVFYDSNWQKVKEKSFSAHTQNRANFGVRSFLLHGLAQAPSGDIYLTGYANLNETTSLSTNLNFKNNRSNGILVKLDSNLDLVWSRSLAYYQADASNPVVLPDGKVAFQTSFHEYVEGESPEIIGAEDVFSRGADLEGYLTHLIIFNEDGDVERASSMDRVLVERQMDFDKYLDLNGMGNLTMPVLIFSSDGPINVAYSDSGSDQIYEEETFNRNQQYFGFLEFLVTGDYSQRRIVKRRGNTRVEMNMGVVNSPICGSYFIYGQFFNTLDLGNSEDGSDELVLTNTDGTGDYFVANYQNEIPRIFDYEEEHISCDQERIEIPFRVSDEDVNSLEYNIDISDNTFLKSSNVRLSIREDIGKVIIEYVGSQDWQTDITLRVTDLCGFFSEAKIFVSRGSTPETPKLNISDEVVEICEGDSVELISSIDSNNIWSNGENSKSIIVTEPGEYWVKQVSPSGCKSANSDTVRVIVFQPTVQPIITSSASTTLCFGESVTLYSSLKGGMLWSNGEQGDSLVVEEAGVYNVVQVSECGEGIVSEDVEVVIKPVPDKPVVSVIGSTVICEGEQIVLRSSQATGNLWSNGMTDREITVSKTGKYWLNVVSDGCISQTSDTVNLQVDPQFELSLVDTRTLCDGFDTIVLIPESTAQSPSFTWSTGETSKEIYINQVGEYWVEVSKGECTNRAFVQVLNECKPVVSVPNAFSPNGDGINDTFEIMARGLYSFELYIFDKWGGQIFYTKDFNEVWDGSNSSGEWPSGQYPYKIVYSGLIDNKQVFYSKKGTIKLVR